MPRPPKSPPPADADATMQMDAVPPADEANATMVFDTKQASRSRGPTGTLVVVNGTKAGSEFTLGAGETSIGRQNDNTIVIPDISVSRKHVIIRKEGAGFVLVDLGSGNGTLVNGERIEGEVELNDGDVFAMGDTEITFKLAAAPEPAARPAARASPARPGSRPSRVVPAARPRPRPAPVHTEEEEDDEGGGTNRVALERGAGKKRRRKTMMLAVAGGVLLVGGLVGFKLKQQADFQAAERAKQQAFFNEVMGKVSEAEEAGKVAIREGKFKQALASFEAAMEAAGQVGQEAREAKLRIGFVKQEIANQEAFEAGSAALEAGELADGVAKLDSIRDDSFFYDRVAPAKAAAKAKIPERLLLAKGAIDAKDLETARKAVSGILALDPTNTEALKLQKDIDAPAPVQTVRPVSSTAKADPTEQPLAAFRGGRLDEAIGMASGCADPACKDLAQKLTDFRAAYNDLGKEGNAEKAMGLLKKIGGGGPYAAEISKQGTAGLVKQGLAAMSAGDLPKAFKAFTRVKKIDPSNDTARKHLSQIEMKAQDLYRQAYVDRGIEAEKACREFEMVLKITEPGSEYHQKALSQHKKCGGG